MTQGRRVFDAAQGEEYPTVIASLDLESAESRVAMSRWTSWTSGLRIKETSPTLPPEIDIVFYADLGARPKVSSDPRNPMMSVDGRDRELPSKPPLIVVRTRQEVWKQLEDNSLKIGAIPLTSDAITRIKKSVGMHTEAARG